MGRLNSIMLLPLYVELRGIDAFLHWQSLVFEISSLPSLYICVRSFVFVHVFDEYGLLKGFISEIYNHKWRVFLYSMPLVYWASSKFNFKSLKCTSDPVSLPESPNIHGDSALSCCEVLAGVCAELQSRLCISHSAFQFCSSIIPTWGNYHIWEQSAITDIIAK